MSSEPKLELRERTKAFALRVVRLFAALPKNSLAQTLGHQVLRSGTSVGANYREATRGRSPAEFISKLSIVLQELDETDYWLELLADSGVIRPDRLSALRDETSQLIAIFVTSLKTAKRNRDK